MLKEALKIVLIVVMEIHVYIFRNDKKLQRKGGPIGLDLTGTIAHVFMLWWDRELRTKLRDLKIECSIYRESLFISIMPNTRWTKSSPSMAFYVMNFLRFAGR